MPVPTVAELSAAIRNGDRSELAKAITLVESARAEIGRLAAERLFARIGGDADPPEVRLVPTRLVRRGSGEIPPPG